MGPISPRETLMFPGPGGQKDLGRYLALGQVGLEMAAPIALGMLLDSYMGWSPWGIIAGAVIGLIGGLTHLVQMTSLKDKKKPVSGPGSPPRGAS